MHIGTNTVNVRATDRILDEGCVFAEPGALGGVLDMETQEDGVIALTVQFEGAERVTTVYLDVDCELVPFEFTGVCARCGELSVGRTVHRACEDA